MAGFTDLPMRLVAYRCGAAYAVGEMLSAKVELWGTAKSAARLRFDDGESPRAVQILAATPEEASRAVRRAKSLGADVVELNMGCPVRKVMVKGAGAALMREPGRAEAILAAMGEAAQESGVTATVKMRLGFDEASLTAPEIAKAAQQAGFAMVTVHARTARQAFAGRARHELLKPVRDAIDIPLAVNGDITGAETARKALADSGADAVAVGRAALSRPWVFGEIDAALSGKPAPVWTDADRLAALALHWQRHKAFYGIKAHMLFKKRLKLYAQAVPGLAQALEGALAASQEEFEATMRRLTQAHAGGQA